MYRCVREGSNIHVLVSEKSMIFVNHFFNLNKKIIYTFFLFQSIFFLVNILTKIIVRRVLISLNLRISNWSSQSVFLSPNID